LSQSDGDRVLLTIPLQVKEPFYIRYIHSIHLTPVIEKYYVDEAENIVVDSVTYESYGVGMPSDLEPGQTFRQEDGKFIVGNMNRKLPYFDQRIGQVIANHTLIIRNQEIPLSEVSRPGSSVRFQATKETAAQIIGRGFLQWLNKKNLKH
jgi:hypothetical protein